MSYRLKRSATPGDIARISMVCFTASSLAWLANAFLLRDFELIRFQTILEGELVVLGSYFMLKGTMFDFTGAPERPKGWLASTYLEEPEDHR